MNIEQIREKRKEDVKDKKKRLKEEKKKLTKEFYKSLGMLISLQIVLYNYIYIIYKLFSYNMNM